MVPRAIESFLSRSDISDAQWLLPRPRGTIYCRSVPVFATMASTCCWVEEFDVQKGRGWISSIDTSSDGHWGDLDPAIELPVHMSYPFIVEDNGHVYCIPETADASEIALYEAEEFPRAWQKRAVLLNGIAALDPTIVRYDRRWWLFCAIKDRYGGMHLHAYHASALAGPWTSHARNPVKTDIGSTRPAGTPFVHDGHLYRPCAGTARSHMGAAS